MTPLQRYQQDLRAPGFVSDPAQAAAMEKFQQLFELLVARQQSFIKKFSKKKYPPIKGLYFWGDVGVGKTYLMDVFYESLPFDDKLRIHFHRFMRIVHQKLTQYQGERNPLINVAKYFSSKAQIICFDEFYVSDIADAMLLAGLFEQLFQRGVTLVATSNCEPDELYRNGLQRGRFLPAIDLIKQHTDINHLISRMDYRLRTLEHVEIFLQPLNQDSTEGLAAIFESMCHGSWRLHDDIMIEQRAIRAERIAEDMIWFDFMVLCNIPRSQMDYLEIARSYRTVFVSNIPVITELQQDLIRNFINLVDVLYDTHVTLIASAAAPVDELYVQGPLVFEYRRTRSRLQEMQSKEYLSLPHLG